MPSISEAFHRLWQPRKGLFWLMLCFQGLASLMAGYVHVTDPPIALRLIAGFFALTNTLISWWLAARLWREAGPRADP